MNLAELIDIKDFKASDGWLDNFKKRYNIKFKTLVGESFSINSKSLLEWQRTVLYPTIKNYSEENVFNMDETGLFWQLLAFED